MPLGPDFVRTDGTAFSLDGKPFRVAGANNYYLGFESDAMVGPVFDLAVQMGFNAIRTWAFLDCGAAAPGATPANAKDGVFFHYWNTATAKPDFNDGPSGLERLDRTIALAEERGIRLILPLVNYWPDFGGVDQYLAWFNMRGRDRFYRDATLKQTFRDWVAHLLLRVNTRTGRRYADEPAILAWELANEPRCVDENGKPLADGIDTLTAWVADMSAFVKSLDPNHLVGIGDEGYFRRNLAFNHTLYNGSFGVDCERLLGVAGVDFGTCHLYPDYAAGEDPVVFGSRWITEHIQAAQRAHKPMLIEEYGLKVEAGLAARNAAFQTWLNDVVANQGAGAMVWMIASVLPDGQRYPDYDHYTVYTAQDVPAILSYTRTAQASAASHAEA